MKELWDRLGRVRASRLWIEEGGTTREGSGTVTIGRADPLVIEWVERGSWKDASGHETPYHDRLRWTLDGADAGLSLYHLRQGVAHPVHLADLRPHDGGSLVPAGAHLCGRDTYIAELRPTGDGIKVIWHVSGPKKSYALERLYR